jgi:hypothetical protein
MSKIIWKKGEDMRLQPTVGALSGKMSLDFLKTL